MDTDFPLDAEGGGVDGVRRVLWTGGRAGVVCGVRVTGFEGKSESPKKSTLLLVWGPLAVAVTVATNNVGVAVKELADIDALLSKLGTGLREFLGLLAKLTNPISLSVDDCIVNISLGMPVKLRLASVSCEDLLLVISLLASRSVSFQSAKAAPVG